MRLRLLISLSLLLLAVPTARAQTADDYFNSGAQLYISNNIPAALERTENGLKLYPDNVKLKKLEELLKHQQQQQSQQNRKQKQQNPSQPQNSSSQKNQKQQKQQQPEQQKKQQQEQSSASQSPEKQNEQKESARVKTGNQMSPEEAKRLLDAQKGNEQFLQLKPKVPPRNSQQPVEDW